MPNCDKANVVPFNRPQTVGREKQYIENVLATGNLAGDGPFSKWCQEWLLGRVGGAGALLTHSCTGALEMACLLADMAPGDEVILPSYTFVSTANAVVLRGATPVFVDIRADTLNIDERLIEGAVTTKTKAIVAVHYAGVAAEMAEITRLARRHGLFVIEDAAQALLSTYHGRPAGSFSDAAAFSFHETKNVISGEGGALIVRDSAQFARAEIIREKGTNRREFFRGAVDKYSWVDVGSSYLPGELIAAFLAAQLEKAMEVTAERLSIWAAYNEAFADLEARGLARRPVVPAHCRHNGHLYYLVLAPEIDRDDVIARLKSMGIVAPFHYVPLHSAPAGVKYGRVSGHLCVTEDIPYRLVRLPIFPGAGAHVGRVIDAVQHAVLSARGEAR